MFVYIYINIRESLHLLLLIILLLLLLLNFYYYYGPIDHNWQYCYSDYHYLISYWDVSFFFITKIGNNY